MFLEERNEAKRFQVGLRKLNVILLIPSAWPANTRLKVLRVRRIFNWMRLGLKLWTYEIDQHAYREKSNFFWVNPEEIYGVFDTSTMPADDYGIGDWLNDEIKKHIEKESPTGRSSRIVREDGSFKPNAFSGMAKESGVVWDEGGMADLIDSNEEVAEDISILRKKIKVKRL